MPTDTLRYTESELSVIKNTFADNDGLLKALQKFFLQIPLNVVDLSLLQTSIKSKELLKTIKKVVFPELTDDVPFLQIWDYTLGIDFKGKMQEQIVADIKSNKLFIDYFKQQLKALENGEWAIQQKIKLSELGDITDKLDTDLYIDTLARNNIIGTVSGRMSQLYVLAGRKTETPEEQEKRLTQDSTK